MRATQFLLRNCADFAFCRRRDLIMVGLFGEPSLTPARYLSWAVRNPAHIRVLEFPVALQKMPPGVESMMLYDISLMRKGSDEQLCRTHPVLWRRVARGNVLLRIRYTDGAKDEVRFVLQGLRKFAAYEPLAANADQTDASNSANTDQEFPDPDSSDNYKCGICEAKIKTRGPNWPAFFVGGVVALDSTETYIATEKENGEAAHFSVVEVNGDVLYVIGSKNVHMVIREANDLAGYQGGAERLLPPDYVRGPVSSADSHDRFTYAKRIASTLMDLLFEHDRSKLIDVMLCEGVTANFELIDPGSRHFVYYDDVPRPELRFIAWTSVHSDPISDGLTRQYLTSLQLAQEFGLKAVQYRCYGRNDLNRLLEDNLPRINSEGVVVYCCDDMGRTLGLWKIKTVWYTMHKCICNVLLGPKKSAMDTKVQEFGRKLSLAKAEIDQWRNLSRDFYLWLEKHGLLEIDNLRSRYSSLFSEYQASL